MSDDLEQHFEKGLSLGVDVVKVALDAADDHGLAGLYKVVDQLSDDQARWGLLMLVWFERERMREIVRHSGISPN